MNESLHSAWVSLVDPGKEVPISTFAKAFRICTPYGVLCTETDTEREIRHDIKEKQKRCDNNVS